MQALPTAQNTCVFGVSAENAAGTAETFTYVDAVLVPSITSSHEGSIPQPGRDRNQQLRPHPDTEYRRAVLLVGALWTPRRLTTPRATTPGRHSWPTIRATARFTFPALSTEGVDNVRISVSMLHGTMSSTEVVIAAVTPDDPFIPIETIGPQRRRRLAEDHRNPSRCRSRQGLGRPGTALLQPPRSSITSWLTATPSRPSTARDSTSRPCRHPRSCASAARRPFRLPCQLFVAATGSSGLQCRVRAENGTELAMPLFAADYTGVQVPLRRQDAD